MNNPPGRYDVTVRVARDDGHPAGPAGFAVAASRAASTMNASVISARTAQEVICVAGVAAPERRLAVAVARPSWPARSMLRIRSGHPAGERPVPAVVRRLEEHRLPELLVAAGARDPDVSHAAAAPGRFPGRLAEARRPAHLRVAGPQLVAERAGFRFVLEQRNGHLNDHGLTGCHESMTIVTCTEDRYRDPGPRRVTTQRVWCSIAAWRSGCDAVHRGSTAAEPRQT
jgi:hypothetical protein